MPSDGMTDVFQEVTLAQRQDKAFQYLRDKARLGHNEGDGLNVNLLSLLALKEATKLAKQKSLSLSLCDLRWAYILAHYWLIEDFVLITDLSEALKNAPQSDGKDRPLLDFLNCYNNLVAEPLWNPPDVLSRLRDSKLDWITPELPCEDLALLEHVCELLWYREPQGESWKIILDSWAKLPHLPVLCRKHLTVLTQRLTLQSSLTVPGVRYRPLEREPDSGVLAGFPLAEFWFHALNGNQDRLDQAIGRFLPQAAGNSAVARTLLDFLHRIETHSGQRDPQTVRLARRRVLSGSAPLLSFGEARSDRLSNLLQEIFQVGEQAGAHLRFHAFRLGMLCELAALRLWDFGEWQGAIQAQSDACLEVARWDRTALNFATNGIRLAVVSLRFNEKRALIRQATELIEFADNQKRSELIKDVLSCYPLQGADALRALAHFTDAIPEELWGDTARWSRRFVDEGWNDHRKSTGWSLLPLSFWGDLFPHLPASSPVWELLKGIVISEARNPFNWATDKQHFFQGFFLHAPIEGARLVARAMLEINTEDVSFRGLRFRMLRIACENRQEFAAEFREDLIRRAETPFQHLRLRQKLLEGPVALEVEQAAKNELRKALDELIARALPTGKPSYPMRLDVESYGMIHWSDADIDIVERIIEAVSNKDLLRPAVSSLLLVLGELVENGPVRFAQRIQKPLSEWFIDMPHWRVPEEHGGPLSAVHFRFETEGEIQNALSIVAYRVRKPLAGVMDEALFDWAMRASATSHLNPAPHLVLLALALASARVPTRKKGKAATPRGAQLVKREALLDSCRAVLQKLWNRYQADHSEQANLFWGLRCVNLVLIKENNPVIDWSRSDPSVLSSLLTELGPMLLEIAACGDPNLRAKIARMLRRFSQWVPLPPELTSTLTRLTTDARARVRRAATGDS